MVKISQLSLDNAPTIDDSLPAYNPGGLNTPRFTLSSLITLFFNNIPSSVITTASIQDNAVTPTKRSGGFYAAAIDIGAGGSGTGPRSFTGFGFKPKAIIVIGARTSGTAIVSYNGYAYDTGSSITQGCHSGAFSQTGPTGATQDTTSNAFYTIGSSGATDFLAAVTSFDTDGMTVNVTTGSATLAFRTYHVIALA